MGKKIWAAAAAAVMAFGALSIPAFADERSDLVDQQAEQDKQKEQLQSQLEGIDVDLQSAYLNLEQTRGKIPAAQQALDAAESELSAAVREEEANAALLEAAQGELETIGNEIAESEENAKASKQTLGELARASYRGDMMPSSLELLFGSATAEEFANAYRAQVVIQRTQSASLAEFEQRAVKAEQRKNRQSAVEDQIQELKKQSEALVAAQQEKRDAAQASRNELAALEKQYSDQSAQFEAKKADYQKSLANLESERAQTANRIAQIDAENQRKAEEQRRAAAAQGQAAAPAPRPASGSWIQPPVPAPVYVTSPFGMRVYPFGGTWMHEGVDLRSPCGEAQTAPADGVVSAVVPAPGNSTHGNQIFINHGVVGGNSYVTVTNHLSAFNVRVGQHVSQGDVIGWTGQTGLVTACHAHFEVWQNGRVIDPMGLSSFTRRWS